MRGPVLIFSSPRDVVTQENTNVELNCAGKSSHNCNKKLIGVMRIVIRINIRKSALSVICQVPFRNTFMSIQSVHKNKKGCVGALYKAMTTFNFPPPEISWLWAC